MFQKLIIWKKNAKDKKKSPIKMLKRYVQSHLSLITGS